jgi:hypothetical protein
MRKILSYATMAAIVVLACGVHRAAALQPAAPAKKTPAKKTSARKKSSSVRKSTGTAAKRPAAASAHRSGTTTKSASARTRKTTGKRGVTWRNRQTSPSPDRYREIQGALASKGFLQPQDATGTWNQTSADALKKFQKEQNLDSNGKINSLSLIALGLGPHHDSAPPPAK